MTKAKPKTSAAAHSKTSAKTTKTSAPLQLSASIGIPFEKLALSENNVRTIKDGVTIEQLADDIAHRTLLQSLSVRHVLDAAGAETGMYHVQAGGRRYRALALLVKTKRLAKDAIVPCVLRTDGLAEEDSLAENTHREALHPLDQFRAFKALVEKGVTAAEIAARFFTTATVVKQRLALANVSPKLHDLYAKAEMTLEQLMAFTVTTDHARQETVWANISPNGNHPQTIRRKLTETSVSADDRL